MSTRSLGTLTLDLIAKIGGFEQGMDQASRVAAKRSAEIRKGVTDATKDIVGAVAAMDLGRRFGEQFKAAIDRADELGKMAQKVGASVESLSSLQFAADMNGVQDFTASLAKLNDSAVKASTNIKGEQAAAFKALGIDVRDASGALKASDVILREVIDRFGEAQDGAEKTAVAMTLFGRSGAELIPFLNQGAGGLKKLEDQARAVGVVIGGETAAGAARFNDNLAIVHQAAIGLSTQVAAKLLPVMGDLSQQFVDFSTDEQTVAGTTAVVETAIKDLIVVGIGAKAAFEALGTAIGITFGALARIQDKADFNWTDILFPVKGIIKFAGAAKEEIGAIADSYHGMVDSASADIERIMQVLAAGTEATDAQAKAQANANDQNGKATINYSGLLEKLAGTDAATKKYAGSLAELAKQQRIYDLVKQGMPLDEATYRAEYEAADALTQKIMAQKHATDELVAARKADADAATASFKEQQDYLGALQDRIDSFLNADDFKSQAASMRDAFGSIGEPIVALIDSFQELGKVSKSYADADGALRQKELQGYDVTLERQEAQRKLALSMIGTYGDMAAGAANFFDKGTTGYKSLQAVSAVFHAAELAASVAELVPKGISAVLTQGEGDPYSAFERMAAMAAIVAGLGVAIAGVSGGGGSFTKPNTGIGAGKGTVLGDSDATSKSIDNSLDALVDLQDKGLFVAQSQLDALRAIQAGITGVGNLLYRSNVSAGGPTPFNVQTQSDAILGGFLGDVGNGKFDIVNNITRKMFGGNGTFGLGSLDIGTPLLSKIVGGILGGTKKKQVDSGLFIKEGQSLGSILNDGLDALYYATIKITKKHMFGLSKNTKYKEEFADVDDQLTKQFGDIILGIGDSAKNAAEALGVSRTEIENLLSAYKIDIGKISLDDLKPDELNDKLNAVFSALGDDIVAALQDGIHEGGVDLDGLLPGLDQFQKAGEGLYETLLRVASETVAVQHVVDVMGMSFGTLTKLDLAEAAENIIELSGGIDQFASNVNDFLDGFLDDTQKLQMQGSQLREQMQGLGLVFPATRDGFADLVQGLDLTSEEGQAAYASLLALSGQAAQFYDTVESNYSDFVDGFLSDSDRLTIEGAKLNDQLAALGYALPGSRDGFAQIVQGIDRTTDAGEALYEALLSLSGQAGSYYDELESAAEDQLSALTDAISDNKSALDNAVQDYKNALNEIAQTLKDQLSGISDARDGIGAGVLSVRRSSGFDEVGYQQGIISSLYDQIGSGTVEEQTDTVKQLTDAIQSRYSAELAQINDARNAAQSLYATQQQTIDSLRDALKGLKDYADSLKLSDLSPLTNAARLTESRNQYGSALLQAQRGSDPAAIAALQNAAGAYLTEARSYNASSEDYTKLFDAVEGELYRVAGRSVGSALPPNTGVYDQQIANLQSKAVDELLGLQDVLDDVSVQAHEEAMQQTDALTVTFQQSAADIIESISKASEEAAAKLSEQMAAARAQAQKISADNIAALQAVVIATIQGSAATVAAISAIPPPPSTAKVA